MGHKSVPSLWQDRPPVQPCERVERGDQRGRVLLDPKGPDGLGLPSLELRGGLLEFATRGAGMLEVIGRCRPLGIWSLHRCSDPTFSRSDRLQRHDALP